jgi:hypothetical protein
MPQVTIDVPQATLNMVSENDISLEELLRLGQAAFAELPRPVTIEVPQDALDFLEEYEVTHAEALESGIRYIRWRKALDKFDRTEIAVDPDDGSPRRRISFETPKKYLDFVAENDLDLAGVFYRGYTVISEEIPNEETQRAMNGPHIEYANMEEMFKALGLDKW